MGAQFIIGSMADIELRSLVISLHNHAKVFLAKLRLRESNRRLRNLFLAPTLPVAVQVVVHLGLQIDVVEILDDELRRCL